MALTVSGLTGAIETAFAAEWQSVRNAALPGAGGEDRRLLFAAIARGVLGYLKTHERELISRLEFEDLEEVGRSRRIRSVDLNIGTGG